jgi:hypothetical protein
MLQKQKQLGLPASKPMLFLLLTLLLRTDFTTSW